MLPTPAARDHKDRTLPEPKHRPGAADSVPRAVRLLPTPVVNDMGANKTPQQWDQWTDEMRRRHGNGNGHGPSLGIEAQRLLPTPLANCGTGAGHTGRAGGMNLQTVAASQDFGQYTPAIARWVNVIGRPAPAPATGHRLNPVFVEWMMGLPEGHVTGHASPPQALKMLGNGVVPQQAALALSLLDPR